MKAVLIVLFCAIAVSATEPLFVIDGEANESLVYKINENFKDVGINKLDIDEASDTYLTKASATETYVQKTDNDELKMVILSTATGSVEGDTTFAAHGLTASDITGMTIFVYPTADSAMPPSFTAFVGYEYHGYLSGTTNIDIVLDATNSENILSKPVKIVVFYTD